MSETWVNFTDSDVMMPNLAERVSIVTIKKRDDLPEICAQVTTQIRQAYENGGREVPSGDENEGTIPEGLKARAIAIALWRFVSEGVPKNEGIQTRAREAAYKEATDFLEKIAQREIKSPGSAQIVSSQTRQATRAKLDGL
jgi:hypothetical protein